MSKKGKIILILLALVFLFSSSAISVTKVQAATCAKYHIVKKGEWLAKIGRYYGVSWKDLAKINNLKNPSIIYPGQKLCISLSDGTTPPKPPLVIPTFTISSVIRDTSVTIQTNNFPANDTFRVLMGPMGTRGINGIHVDTINSGTGGVKTMIFLVPAALRGMYQIAIRLESPGSGLFAYNWFYNNTTSGNGGTGGAKPVPGYTGIPVFFISAVVRNETVTITTKNFPAGLSFDVLMGSMGTRAVNGIKVGTLNSGSGGKITATFQIPNQLRGSYQIAIRAQNYTHGYYAYNWFYNNSTK